MASPVVELRNLHKSYYLADNQEVAVLKGLNIKVEQGEFVGIVGQSGSGKSTLLNILGLLDLPTQGSYLLNGVHTEVFSDDLLAETRNRSIGFIFQSFNLFNHLTIEENLEVPLIYAEVPAKERALRTVSLLTKVGLGHRLGHKPTELSGGEMQRVAIARALSNNPAFLLADEPTGNLDEDTSREIISMFRELHEKGTTIVMVTHNLEYESLFDRVIKLRDGRVVDFLPGEKHENE